MAHRSIAIVLFAACLSAVHAADTTRIFGSLYFSGKITPSDAELLSKRLDGSIKRVNFRSPGGDVLEAIAIADVMQKSGLPMEVSNYCLSACALIFALTENHTIRPGGYLAFHGGETGWVAEMGAAWLAYEPKSEAIRERFFIQRAEKLAEFAAKKDAFRLALLRRGHDASWHDTLMTLTSPKLREVEFDEETLSIKAQLDLPICDWWVPDRLGLEEIGIALNRFDVPDRLEVGKLLNLPSDRIYWGRLSELTIHGPAPCNALEFRPSDNYAGLETLGRFRGSE
jgi:hypothetical protein